MSMTEGDLNEYRGYNPSFARRVQQKRREAAGSRWPEEARDRIKDMLERGFSARQIALRFDCKHHCIISLVHRDPRLKAVGFTRARRVPRSPTSSS